MLLRALRGRAQRTQRGGASPSLTCISSKHSSAAMRPASGTPSPPGPCTARSARFTVCHTMEAYHVENRGSAFHARRMEHSHLEQDEHPHRQRHAVLCAVELALMCSCAHAPMHPCAHELMHA